MVPVPKNASDVRQQLLWMKAPHQYDSVDIIQKTNKFDSDCVIILVAGTHSLSSKTG